MNILVLNGSPKGEYSITLQTVRYLEQLNPQHTFHVLHVGQRIKALERDFSPALEAVRQADILLFSYPVYTFLAPAQLHRFIELLKPHKALTEGKFATQITTSKHFYDVTAHAYIRDNCEDLGLKYVNGLSADMEDLLSTKGQQEARQFWEHFCWCVQQGMSEPYYPQTAAYLPVTAQIPAQTNAGKQGDVVIVADLGEDDCRLKAMVERFQAVLPRAIRVVNIRQYPFSGGCLGCFHCASDGTCIYKDGFDAFLRREIQNAEAIVYAFSISDHSMGARFKMYDDRQFCNGHRTVTMGAPVGYLISGNYAAEPNVRSVVECRAQVGGNPLAGVATDHGDPDAQIDRLAASLTYALEHHYSQPQNFYGIGGMKIFRDLIYQMRGMMKADHRFYKANGQYDFPQKRKGTILKMYLVGALMSSPTLRAKAGNQISEGMIAPYRKVLENLKKAQNK